MDASAYIQAVLHDAADVHEATGELPDHFRRFVLPETMQHDESIQQAIAEVATIWARLHVHPKYGPLVDHLASELDESRSLLLDPGRRAAYRQALLDARQREEAARLQELDDELARFGTKGHLTPDEFQSVVRRFRSRGFNRAEVAARLRVPVHERSELSAPALLPSDLMDRIQQNLELLGPSAAHRNLWTFLGVRADSSEDQIRAAHARKVKQLGLTGSGKPAGSEAPGSPAANLLAAVQALLLDRDPSAYETSRRHRVARDALMPLLEQAAKDPPIDRARYATLLDRADVLALPREFAVGFIEAFCKERRLVREIPSDPRPRIPCPACHAFNLLTDRACRHENCRESLVAACPECGLEHRRAQEVCAHCGCLFAHHGLVETYRLQLRELLDERDLAHGPELLTEIARTVGRPRALQDLLGDLEARLEVIRLRQETLESAISRHALGEARREIEAILGWFPGYRSADGTPGAAIAAHLGEQWHATDAFLERAREHEREGRYTEAQAAYAVVLANVSDHPEALAGLDRCPPEAPRQVQATLEGDRVTVSWRRSLTPGDLTYVVVRGQGRAPSSPSDGTVVARTRETRVTDDSVPPGEWVVHAVFAQRGKACSAPAGAEPVLRLHEVEHLKVEIGDGEVKASWDPLPAGLRVRVFRGEGGAPSAGDGVEVGLTGPASFLDRGLANDRPVGYRVRVEHPGLEGMPVLSPGLTVEATPEEHLQPVTRLAGALAPEGLVLTWAAPDTGEVLLFRLDRQAPWSPGKLVPSRMLSRLGTPLPVKAGERRLLLPAPGWGRHVVVAVTRSGERALIGDVWERHILEDVTDLQVHDHGHCLACEWTWPVECSQVLVTWRHDRYPEGPDDPYAERRRVTLGEYLVQGGFRIEEAPDQMHHVLVLAGAVLDSVVTHAPGVAAGCRAIARGHDRHMVRVEFQLPRFGSRRFHVELTALGQDLVCPELVLVARRGTERPGNPGDGEVLGVWPGGMLLAGVPRDWTLDLERVPRPAVFRVFFRDTSSYEAHRFQEPAIEKSRIR